jgi:predicted GTPase
MDTGDKDSRTQEDDNDTVDGIGPTIDIEPDLEKLRGYTQAKLGLADQLRIVREALTALGREKAERQCGELVVKLAEDRFTLAVLGQFKRGKSSLMNAIIGRELLPTGVLPLTSAITVLKYGPTERLVINREGFSFQDELPISSLPDYVTEKGNPANEKKVRTAYVELPVSLLRRGLEFVDTPGVGSAITANTATTYSFLPACDAVLFVTSVDTPMTSLELAFLKEIREYVDKIFFIVNKTDTVADDERDEILNFVAKTIQSQIGSGDVKVFAVSARLGLAAKASADNALYAQSGLKTLEEAMASFLSEEKSLVFLTAIAQKALRVLDDEEAQGAFGEAALDARARAIQQEKPVTVRRDPRAAAAAVKEAREKLEALYRGIRTGQMTEASRTAVPTIITAQASNIETPTLTPQTVNLQTRGCPVCQQLGKYAFDFFAHWQYQIATEERAQAEFAAELGFCPLHTWQLLSVSSPHGASIGIARLAEQISRNLREDITLPAKVDAVRRLIRYSQNCLVCKLLRQVEGEYIRQLAATVNEVVGRNRYRRSQGVCLRHLGLLMNAVSTPEAQEFLLSHAARRFDEDAEDMRSYAMKREALRRQLHNRNEEDAYLRAIIRTVGERNVSMPWVEEREI